MKYAIILLLFLFPLNSTLNITPTIVEDYNVYMGFLDIEITITAKKYSDKEVKAAQRCACGEAEGEGLEGQLAVLNVIVNRMVNANKSLLEVVYREGQFHGMRSRRPITESCKKAVNMVLFQDVRVLPSDVEYFLNEQEMSPHSKWLKRLMPQKWGEIGKHSFFKKIRV